MTDRSPSREGQERIHPLIFVTAGLTRAHGKAAPCRRVPLYAHWFLKFSSPRTTPVFWLGWDAFCLGGFSALGLRISLLDFF
jgi:hypothetical protein